MHGVRRARQHRAMQHKGERAAADRIGKRSLCERLPPAIRAVVATVTEDGNRLSHGIPVIPPVPLMPLIPPNPAESRIKLRCRSHRTPRATRAAAIVRNPGQPAPPPGSGPAFMNAFSTLAVTFDALLSQALMGSAWPQAMELADHTAPSFGVVK